MPSRCRLQKSCWFASSFARRSHRAATRSSHSLLRDQQWLDGLDHFVVFPKSIHATKSVAVICFMLSCAQSVRRYICYSIHGGVPPRLKSTAWLAPFALCACLSLRQLSVRCHWGDIVTLPFKLMIFKLNLTDSMHHSSGGKIGNRTANSSPNHSFKNSPANI